MKYVILIAFFAVSVVLPQEGGTPNSVWMYVGSTNNDYQTVGSTERLIAVGPSGEVHFVWMSYRSEFHSARYNCIELFGDSIENSVGYFVGSVYSRFPYIAVGDDGRAIIAAHANPAETITNPFLTVDVQACTGSLDVSWGIGRLPYCEQRYWPHIDIDSNGKIHVVATNDLPCNTADYDRVEVFFADSVNYEVDPDTTIGDFAESLTGPFIDVACARTSQRVAVAWIADTPGQHESENVMLRISEDGGVNWSDNISVTGLRPIDTLCVVNGGDPDICNGDTLRPWRDLSLIFDNNSQLHMAFSASGFFYFNREGDVEPRRSEFSTIWHWFEETGEFSLIGEAWFGHDSVNMATNDLMCQKPSLAMDTTTGFLYCAFQQFDRHAFSAEGYPIGEFYMSVSTDNGENWAVPTNVSNTPGVPNNPSGNDPSERDISLAKYVTDGFIHSLYSHDYSAGSYVYGEGLLDTCRMVYMRTPVTDIPTTPLNPRRQFRDSLTFAEEVIPCELGIQLYPNYPNPFNPSTTIQFDLARAGNVRLTVFDVLGKEVATLVDGAISAGAHSVSFDGANLTSGVYFARLEVGGISETRKMVLLK